MKPNRRDVIKTAALAAANAMVFSKTGNAITDDGPPSVPGVEWDKAPCRFCGTGCHVMVGTKDEKVVAIAGDKKADVNKGLLCVKGYHVGGILYGRDRLTTPLLRQNGQHVPISWDRALDIVADKIMESPNEFAFYGSGQWTIPEGYACNKLIKGGLSNNHIDPNARLCMASAVTGFLSTYGVDEPAGCYQDLDECDVLIMWGNNPAEMHPVLFSRVVDRRSKGEEITLIDIGTRYTRTTPHCQHHLPFKPHTDLAIANGIAHLLIKNDTYNKEFVSNYCNFRAASDPPNLFGKAITFDEYKKSVEKYTPEYVEEISGVPAEDIIMLGELFGSRDIKITSLWCMGVNQHTRGTAMNQLIHTVHLLSGHFGTPGDSPTSLTGQPSACGTAREVGTLAHLLPGGRLVANEDHRNHAEEYWNLPKGRVNSKPGYHTVLMWEKFCTATSQGGDIKTIWVQVTNPGHTLPNLQKLFKAKENLDDKFLIVSDVYPTATTKFADLILPAALWVEKNGIYGNSERRTQQWYRQVIPPGEARDDCWMVIAVARKLYEKGHPGMKDKDGNFIFDIRDDTNLTVPIWEWEHYYDVNVDKHLYDEYRLFSRLKHKDLAPYEVLEKARGLRWPVVQQADGTWRETKFRFSEFDDPYVEKGKTFQFYHSTTKDDRAQIWFQPYENPPEMPDDEYGYWLCTGRVLEHWHSGSMTMRVPQLQKSMPNAYVEMHPEDAKDLGIQNGEIVTVETRRGTLQLPAWIEGRGKTQRKNLFVPFFDERLLINDLTLDEVDPFSKQPDYKKAAAKVYKTPKEGV